MSADPDFPRLCALGKKVEEALNKAGLVAVYDPKFEYSAIMVEAKPSLSEALLTISQFFLSEDGCDIDFSISSTGKEEVYIMISLL